VSISERLFWQEPREAGAKGSIQMEALKKCTSFLKCSDNPLAGMGFCKSTDCLRVDFSDNRHIVRLGNRLSALC